MVGESRVEEARGRRERSQVRNGDEERPFHEEDPNRSQRITPIPQDLQIRHHALARLRRQARPNQRRRNAAQPDEDKPDDARRPREPDHGEQPLQRQRENDAAERPARRGEPRRVAPLEQEEVRDGG